jgi:hypothetical protein
MSDPPDADEDRVFEVRSPAIAANREESKESDGNTSEKIDRSPCCCGCLMLTRRQKEAAKLVALCIFGYALYVYYQYVQSAIDSTRDGLRSLPLNIVIPSYLAVSAVRKLVPPINYLAPVGTIFTMYLADVLGPEYGALIYQAVKAQDIM